MSEQQEKQKGFMAELDHWTEENIFGPLLTSGDEGEPEEISEKILDMVKFVIRDKVLESYKNGLRAGAGQVRREFREMPAKNRQATSSGVQR